MMDGPDRSMLAVLAVILLVSLTGCTGLDKSVSVGDTNDSVLDDPASVLDPIEQLLAGPASFRGTVEIPREGVVGEPVTAEISVENVGGKAGSFTANYTVEGEQVDSRTVEVDPGETENFTLSNTFESAGSYDVDVGDLEATVFVSEPSSTDGNGSDGNGSDGNGTDGNQTDGNQTDGNETSAQTRALEVEDVTGDVFRQDQIQRINVTVERTGESGDVDLRNVTVEWAGPDGNLTVVHEDVTGAGVNTFETAPLRDEDGSHPVLNTDNDEAVLTLAFGPGGSVDADPLRAGQSADIVLAPEGGTSTTVTATVPDSLRGENTVDL